MVTVKYKEINKVYGDGRFETKDTRYELRCSIKKVVAVCLRLEFSFRVGFRDNDLIDNKNYVEIVGESFIPVLTINKEKIVKEDMLKAFLLKYSK